MERRSDPPSPALAAIRAALSCQATPIVDRPVALDSEIGAATYGLRSSESHTLYADVPLTAIVGLFHKSFAPEASTWRALFDGLPGRGWGLETLASFEAQIGDAPFPAPSAADPLILRAYGGAVVGVNGIHRLVAAVCWLAARHGPRAALKKVALQCYRVNAGALGVMLDAAHRGDKIDAAYNADCETVLIRTHAPHAPRRAACWRVTGDGVSLAEAPGAATGGWLDAWRRWAGYRPRAEAGLHWQPVSDTVLAALADDRWLAEQLQTPRYVDVPR
ncbi:hypothetical protein GWC77_25145 [Paraburkholderia sp. NMBU_R16]|nr:hypothetical protein [Paraburkholderia sp. NMBU_R16]